jgi:hypothetical protein
MLRVVLGTCLVLLIPLVTMQFSDQVNWTLFDFLVAGVLLLGAGMSYVLTTNSVRNVQRRAVIGSVVLVVFGLLWLQLAVGIID